MKIKNKIMLSAFALTIGLLVPISALVSCSAAFPDDYIKLTDINTGEDYCDPNGLNYGMCKYYSDPDGL